MQLSADRADRVDAIQKMIFTLADAIAPVVDLSRVYVDGLDGLPRDGRFLLVGNHTVSGWVEVVSIPYFVHRELGTRVRGLATRQLADVTGLARDVLDAAGAVVGDPETAAELMRRNETVLVFPGGGRDMLKFKDEEYQLFWEGRSGFARLAIAHDYPIIPVGLVGGDDVYHSIVERDGTWERMTRGLGRRLHGVTGVGIPLTRGLGPTPIPRPQRMYLRFGTPIETRRPTHVETPDWEATVKERTQTALEAILRDLQEKRSTDPFRHLNPLAWGKATRPSGG
ncbi:glycerol acyltransferase [Mycolicibacterium duvalii]|uniref:Membrane protein n=1 Tax=Mycolicibacterium duvalii TaxID=39688 RepID=A0A7I7K8Y7_9MYCO|nr:lysophospholipid acyltransferase family protein [Mycolicibacterium duvalii]MCV7368430.1 acyltransferase family protein [Mycolicibacterium duvalii]PEG41857.1 glycerol acyltransferase [Mycolicibacterium duvalii]BBX20533.1 membrane protein [Mycolicibacterium duvalii]